MPCFFALGFPNCGISNQSGQKNDVINQLPGRPCCRSYPHDSRLHLVWTLIWEKVDGARW